MTDAAKHPKKHKKKGKKKRKKKADKVGGIGEAQRKAAAISGAMAAQMAEIKAEKDDAKSRKITFRTYDQVSVQYNMVTDVDGVLNRAQSHITVLWSDGYKVELLEQLGAIRALPDGYQISGQVDGQLVTLTCQGRRVPVFGGMALRWFLTIGPDIKTDWRTVTNPILRILPGLS